MNFPDLPHLRQLQQELWQWPKSRAAVMVGAGLSLNAEPLPGVSTRFPTWRQLVRAMFDELHPPHLDETPEQTKAREAQFNSGNALRIASEYEAAFDRRKLDLLIRTQNPDSDHQPGRLHHLLLQLPWVDVFTTNYDTLLERTEIAGRTYQPVTKSSELTTAFSPRIVKLHGSFPSQSPFIITEEDYRTYPRNFAPFVNSVQQSLLENSFVLIGFSGDDPNFLEWTGWIRDELGGNHAPIYLVGWLSLGNAERSLLARRGVTPIDLTPVFAGMQTPDGVHAASLEWFLNCLSAARPPRPEKWPNFDRGLVPVPDSRPAIVDAGLVVPENVKLSPDSQHPLIAETVAKVMARWQFERLRYPGWVVAADDKRSELWQKTKSWLTPLSNFAKDWPAVDRILLFREINWRLETSMAPLFSDWIGAFQRALDDLVDSLAEGRSVQPSLDFMQALQASDSNVPDAWLEIAFGLLREARETYNAARWDELKAKIDKVVQYHPQHSDRNCYEAALWAMWNVERLQAKVMVSRWQPSSRSPLAAMWKAALLAELDELGEARTILRAALLETRRALRSQGQNIELLSLEGWCMYLLFAVEQSLDLTKRSAVRDEFWERWQELKAWDCSPWTYREYFETTLVASPPKLQRAEQKIRGFDPGRVTASRHWSGDNISPYLPGFACIRLYEQVGIPMRLPMLNIAGDALKNACRWVAPFIGFWSPALLIRAGNLNDLTKGDFLNRPQVAAMDPVLAKRLYVWCLQILERELAQLIGRITVGSAQESLLKVLSEVLSRLAFKVDATDLRSTFPIILKLHRQPGVRSNKTLHEFCKPWFERLFTAANGDLLLEWLPDLIKTPLFDEDGHPVVGLDNAWPDTMQSFPGGRAAEAAGSRPDLVTKIHEATDWLVRRAASESGEGGRRAIDRLIDIYLAKLMTVDQEQHLGELLWSRRAANGLPERRGFAVFGFLHLPSPPTIDVHAIVKNHILALTARGFVTQDGGETSVAIGPLKQSLIEETLYASTPVIRLAGETSGGIEWTPEESKQLYLKACEWWANDKNAPKVAKGTDSFVFMGTHPVLDTLRILGEFLARAVLPRMEWADENEWQQLLAWLQEVRDFGAFPTLALPYVLLQRPTEAVAVAQTIIADLNSDVDDAVAAAAKAIRHWIHLYHINRVPPPPPNLMAGLTERVAFRRTPSISACLLQVAYLIIERPEMISPSQAALLTASLEPWHHATILPAPDEVIGDFHEVERPDLRVLIGRLAGALMIWHAKSTPQVPEPPAIALWRNLCASDRLPEIRRAFNAWNHLER
jgi:hypothetical protein